MDHNLFYDTFMKLFSSIDAHLARFIAVCCAVRVSYIVVFDSKSSLYFFIKQFFVVIIGLYFLNKGFSLYLVTVKGLTAIQKVEVSSDTFITFMFATLNFLLSIIASGFQMLSFLAIVACTLYLSVFLKISLIISRIFNFNSISNITAQISTAALLWVSVNYFINGISSEEIVSLDSSAATFKYLKILFSSIISLVLMYIALTSNSIMSSVSQKMNDLEKKFGFEDKVSNSFKRLQSGYLKPNLSGTGLIDSFGPESIQETALDRYNISNEKSIIEKRNKQLETDVSTGRSVVDLDKNRIARVTDPKQIETAFIEDYRSKNNSKIIDNKKSDLRDKIDTGRMSIDLEKGRIEDNQSDQGIKQSVYKDLKYTTQRSEFDNRVSEITNDVKSGNKTFSKANNKILDSYGNEAVNKTAINRVINKNRKNKNLKDDEPTRVRFKNKRFVDENKK